MAKFKDAYVSCPYYKWEEGYRKCCKGETDDYSIQITFRNKEYRKGYKRKVCKRNWRICPLAQALAGKWEEP